jgi:hypothetical protein
MSRRGPRLPACTPTRSDRQGALSSSGGNTIDVTCRDNATLTALPRAPYAPVVMVPDRRWYKGDFHVHSTQSGDASATLQANVDLAHSRGLDFFNLSDHNTVAQHALVAAQQPSWPVLVLRSSEITTYSGHTNGIGIHDSCLGCSDPGALDLPQGGTYGRRRLEHDPATGTYALDIGRLHDGGCDRETSASAHAADRPRSAGGGAAALDRDRPSRSDILHSLRAALAAAVLAAQATAAADLWCLRGGAPQQIDVDARRRRLAGVVRAPAMAAGAPLGTAGTVRATPTTPCGPIPTSGSGNR